MQVALFEIGKAFDGYFQNFPNRVVARLLKTLIFPFGIHYQMPDDDTAIDVCKSMITPGVMRERLSHLCYLGEAKDDATGLMETAYQAMVKGDILYRPVMKALKAGELTKGQPLKATLAQALEQNILSKEDHDALMATDKLRWEAINVDSFKPGEL
jgi:hypothetical protein